MSLKGILVGLFLVCVVSCIRVPGYDHPEPAKLFLSSFLGANAQASGVGGGTECAGCTAIVAIVEQLVYIHDQPLIELMAGFCDQLPVFLQKPCTAFVEAYGGVIINMIELEETPDRVCQQLGVCTKPECSLFPPPPVNVQERNAKIKWNIPEPQPEWEPLEWINRFVNEHEPLFDLDADKFSDWYAFRGSAWRGKDCDDIRANIYPGRKNSTYNAQQDQDCNGIFGQAENGTSWEDLYCSGTPRYGQVILGDSAAAHFHIPLAWSAPMEMTITSFDDLIPILANELDWPEMSSTTGFTESTWQGHPNGPVISSYLKALDKNRCAFRDYQNIGVNGARTSSMANTIMYSLARDQENDYPVILMYALIGNDVCNGHIGFDHMTTPEEFYQNVVTATNYLDTVLPMGSHVIFMGLADGLILWDAMNARIHPIGQLRQDVTYADLYDYMNCLEISPCWGWLNSDEAVRNETQKRADQLTLVYQDVIRNNSYTHFDMTFVTCPVREMIAIWEDMGGEAWQLIEPVDGFHPNQIGNALIADYIWDLLEKRHPDLIPPENPWNEEIIAHFGDQGGY